MRIDFGSAFIIGTGLTADIQSGIGGYSAKGVIDVVHTQLLLSDIDNGLVWLILKSWLLIL